MKGRVWGWLLGCVSGCHTAGSDWMNQPLPGAADPWAAGDPATGAEPTGSTAPRSEPARALVAPAPVSASGALVGAGRSLGQFRNTYYDFPSESEFAGEPVNLMDASCAPIKSVPVEFHDAVCVQGSGNLTTGVTVSFAKRDCECARTCPRTGQKICFEALSRTNFPWGRGALGKPITPLVTVAVDDTVIPMHTVLYIPEFDGLPRDASQSAFHDGCFVAQDRGLKVKGQHIDVFTGRRSVTSLWNGLVPSNQGVTVMIDAPNCRGMAGPL
ncbi:MAG TPA: 3D domain-containing protein [Polyangiaceae bacterium]|nr:3D domain-containing protein [Polyangiaceae bacterium]